MKVEGILQKKTSKAGKEYYAITIKLGEYEKVVFLQGAEVELVKLLVNAKN